MISLKAAGISVLGLVWILAIPISAREGKLFSLFSIVQFENGPCMGANGRNGTCYTAGECDQRGGTNDGTCAAGFGVCCTFVKMCGETVSQACSYLVPSNPLPASGDCSYKICKESNDICRIRLDFQTFMIANPHQMTQIKTDVVGNTINDGGIGDCLTDSFSAIVPGGNGSPEICGFNTGQHMVLDASDQCISVSFRIGTSSQVNRDWDIKVSQLECSSKEGGPPGCLQYLTESAGTISSFGYGGSSANGLSVPHLSNQHYSICFRNPLNICGICFTLANDGLITASEESFGLSGEMGANALFGTSCTSDYLMIPDLAVEEINPTSGATVAVFSVNRLCGREFSAATLEDTFFNVCTFTKPFKVVFKTDASEAGEELEGLPLGTAGFALNYVHVACDCSSGSCV